MAVNSYKQDEHSTDVGKMKTLMRLFAYLLDYKKEILAVLAIMAFCVFVSLVNPLISRTGKTDWNCRCAERGHDPFCQASDADYGKGLQQYPCNDPPAALYPHPDPGFFLFRQPSHRQDPRPHYRRHQLLKGRTRQLRHDADPGFFHDLRRRRDHFSQKSGSRSGFPDQPAADDLLHVVYPGVLA